MTKIDLNCDLGEGIGNDEQIIPYISSANVACGYHAGDEQTMLDTIDACLRSHVVIGAHPSFKDRANFGRTEIQLTASEAYALVTAQLQVSAKALARKATTMHHVKPHGALYNMAAKDSTLAAAIANAVKDFDSKLILYGLAGSHSILEANKVGLKTASEVFADRTYQDDGTLMPRSEPGAMIEGTAKAIAQVLQMIKTKTVNTINGKTVPVTAETICIHGDGKNAVEFAKDIRHHLKKDRIGIQTL